ncbi:alpha-tocopherol transfer protein-like protein [Leptotrombidium deliense]|uniref:Alpha-tocopherol transfer protein-like protein n=1 Tax=Leptotrombidium deliense TaxID=299467 RepID=A0A443SFQ3_9ACAR|nr:alpha-tocopherol transfer protein-like protein [Leptotrombidium deliense]
MNPETESVRLREFRAFLDTKEEKVNNNREDCFLLKFLRANDYCVQRSAEQLRRYEWTREENDDLFLFSDQLKCVFDSDTITVSKQRTSKGELVLITRPGLWNASVFSFRQLMRASCVALQMEINDENTQRNGIVNIVDCSQFNWRHLMHFGPLQAKLFADLIDQILPVKYNAIHLVNESRFARFAFNLIKSFLSTKLREKLHFHSNRIEKLHQLVDIAALPHEFGGKSDVYSSDDYYQKMLVM